MYFPEAQARGLIEACAARFPGGRMVFDAVTELVNREVMQHPHYTPPPLLWNLAVRDYPTLRSLQPPISRVREVLTGSGRGVLGFVAPRLRWLPVIGPERPSVVSVTFV
jgi:hypothetical protein